MPEETTDWDLLSNGSGSDIYWPDSEVDDTVSLLESLSFTDSEEGSEGEVESESVPGDEDEDDEENEEEGKKYVGDEVTLVGSNQEPQDILSITKEDFPSRSD